MSKKIVDFRNCHDSAEIQMFCPNPLSPFHRNGIVEF